MESRLGGFGAGAGQTLYIRDVALMLVEFANDLPEYLAHGHLRPPFPGNHFKVFGVEASQILQGRRPQGFAIR